MIHKTPLSSRKSSFILALLAIASQIFAAEIGSNLTTVSKSIVKVVAIETGRTGTGFVWNGMVVTALHVVDGSRNISVYSAQTKTRVSVTVSKVLTDYDLVLLSSVDKFNHIPSVSVSKRTLGVSEQVQALGYRLNIDALKNIPLTVTFGDKKLKNNLTQAAQKAISKNGYPQLDIDVVTFDGHLLPGISGAPILDADGSVVAICDGGLEQGAASISWGIPAMKIDELWSSNETKLPNSTYVSLSGHSLFSADQIEGSTQNSGVSTLGLTKVRTRTLSELQQTNDDPLGLSQLVSVVGFVDPRTTQFDIYVEENSGACIVVPNGAMILWKGMDYQVIQPTNRIVSHFLIENVSDDFSMQQRSVEFQRRYGPENANEVYMEDQSFSYKEPHIRPDGMRVRRHAFAILDRRSNATLRYGFETFIFRSKSLVSYNVIDTLSLVPRSFVDQYSWAQMVLSIHLSDFSQ